MSPNSTTRLEHLLLRVRKEHLRPGAHRDKTRSQHPDIMISIRVQNMMKPQQMVWVLIGQGGRYETGDAGGVLIGGRLGKPGNITQLVSREPCIERHGGQGQDGPGVRMILPCRVGIYFSFLLLISGMELVLSFKLT